MSPRAVASTYDRGMAEVPPIETSGLSKTYAGGVLALSGLDLRVERGEVLGFLGPNGAGKSTTIRLLLDLIRPTAGVARILDRPIRDLSKGNRQKLGLVQAFMHRPDVLVLDEPTGGLDPLLQEEDWRTGRRRRVLSDRRPARAGVLARPVPLRLAVLVARAVAVAEWRARLGRARRRGGRARLSRRGRAAARAPRPADALRARLKMSLEPQDCAGRRDAVSSVAPR